MQRFRITTLVDITRTLAVKQESDPLKKNQQDNLNTIHRTLEMRGNIYFENSPQIITRDWTKEGYGKKEKTWVWDIYTEQDDLFLINDDPVAQMKIELDFTPFVSKCTETADFKKSYFSTRTVPTNILFALIDK